MIKVEVSGLLPEDHVGIIDVYINGEEPVHIGKFNAAGTAQDFRLPYIENELLLIYSNGVRSEFTTADISNSFTVFMFSQLSTFVLPLAVRQNQSAFYVSGHVGLDHIHERLQEILDDPRG